MNSLPEVLELPTGNDGFGPVNPYSSGDPILDFFGSISRFFFGVDPAALMLDPERQEEFYDRDYEFNRARNEQAWRNEYIRTHGEPPPDGTNPWVEPSPSKSSDNDDDTNGNGNGNGFNISNLLMMMLLFGGGGAVAGGLFGGGDGAMTGGMSGLILAMLLGGGGFSFS